MNKITIKVSKEFREFLDKLATNRVRIGSDDKNLSICNIPDIIVKYFKLNNDRYVELAKLEWK